jgi:hypothetical protein
VPEPEIRANHSKHTIARIKTLAEPDRSRILQQIEVPRARIREASVFDWLPVQVHVQLVAGITEMLPPVRALAFYKSLMADAFSKSNAGVLSVDLERGPGEASATFHELPPAIAKSTGMLQFFEGGLCAAVEHFGATPRVRVDVSKLARGEARFEVSWQAAS